MKTKYILIILLAAISSLGFSQALYKFETDNGKFGFRDSIGNIVFEAQFDWVSSVNDISGDREWDVEKNYKRAVIDFNSDINGLFKYDMTFLAVDGIYKVKKHNKYGFINKKGKLITPLKYDDVKAFSEGMAAVSIYGKWGFINNKGKEVIPMKYKYIPGPFLNGIASADSMGWLGYINSNG